MDGLVPDGSSEHLHRHQPCALQQIGLSGFSWQLETRVRICEGGGRGAGRDPSSTWETFLLADLDEL